MKLIFTKKESNDIDVQLQRTVILEDFTYINLVKELLLNNKLEDSQFNNLLPVEIEKVNEMLTKITKVFEETDEDKSIPLEQK